MTSPKAHAAPPAAAGPHRRPFDFGLGAARRAIARHKALAAALFLGTGGLAALASAALPSVWHVETTLLAVRTPGMQAIANPNRTVPRQADAPLRAAGERVLSHDNLVKIIERTDLVAATRRSRAPAERLAAWIGRHLFRPPTEKEELEAMVDRLGKRLYVATVQGEEGALRIGVEWTDGRLAYDIVDAAYASFLEIRRDQDSVPIAEAIAILAQHTEQARREVEAARAEVERRSSARQARDRARRDAAEEALARALKPPPAPRADPERDRELATLKAQLDAKDQQVATLQASRRRQLAQLEGRRAELSAVYSDQHPRMLELQSAIAALRVEPAEVQALRGEVEGLRQEFVRKGGTRAEVASEAQPAVLTPTLIDIPEPVREEADEGETFARGRLRSAFGRRDALQGRLDAAQIELDVAAAAFKYRYTTVAPPEAMRVPARPKRLALALGGLLCAVGLAVFGPLALEATPPGADARRRRTRRRRVVALCALLAVTTVAALTLEKPVAAVAPAVLAALIWAVVTYPLRYTTVPLVFLALAMPLQGESGSHWKAPWAQLGYFLNTNLNLVLPVQALRFTGFDALTFGLLALIAWRGLTGSRLDLTGASPPARPMVWGALGTLGTLGFLVAYGKMNGGDFNQVLWQCHQLAFIAVVFFVFQAAIRGPQDFRAVGVAVLAAALVKAIQAFYIRKTLGMDDEALPTATSHDDSMLFATACCMVLAWYFERRSRRAFWLCAFTLPILFLGMQTNNRRLVWVELALACAFMFALIARTRLKVRVSRLGLALLPIACLYIGAGWNAQSRIFGPVAKIRSIVDSKSNRSTEERDVENYNLITNFRFHPVFGMGFGREYYQYVRGDDISHIFPQWRFIPHNSVLGLFAFGGVLGFTGLCMVLTVGVYLAARGYRWATTPLQRAAALTFISAVLIFLVQCYGDMGLVSWHGVWLLAPGLGLVSKLATFTGAWPARAARARRHAAAPPAAQPAAARALGPASSPGVQPGG